MYHGFHKNSKKQNIKGLVKTLISFRLKKYINILDDMGVSKLSGDFNVKVN